MDVFNPSDGIFREFVHTPDMDSKCIHGPARLHTHEQRPRMLSQR
jgi:hypothetical protein